MTRIGIRELRQRASELLRRVAKGESFEITDRGHPVAVLGPLPSSQSWRERLIASGDLIPATGDLEDLPDPLPLKPGTEPPSQVLARLRRDER